MDHNNYNKAYFFYVLALIFAPLAFGTTEEWSFLLVFLFLGLSFILYALRCWKIKGNLYKIPGFWWLFAGFIFLIFQIIPLPYFITGLFSPKSLAIRAAVFGKTGFHPVSMNIEGGIFTLLISTALFAAYYLGIQFFSDYRYIKKTVFILSIFTGIFAVSSIFQSIFTTDRALWFRYVPHNSMVFGSYVNHNHYAGFMAMVLPFVFGLYLIKKPFIVNKSFREKFLSFFEGDSSYIYIMHLFFCIMIVLSVFMSLSRAGTFSMVFSWFVFAFMLGRKNRTKISGSFYILISAVILISLTWYGWDNLDRRFGQTLKQVEYDNLSRLTFWQDTLQIIKDFSVTGSGTGSFKEIYPAYRSFSLSRIVGHAHNDYLELFSDMGILGAFIVFGFLFTVLFKGFLRFRDRKEKYAVIGFCASVSAFSVIAVHSITDFNLQIFANALTFIVVCSFIISFSHTRFRHTVGRTYLDKSRFNSPIGHLVIFLIIWIPLLFVSIGFSLARINSFGLPSEKITPKMSLKKMDQYLYAAEKSNAYNPFNHNFVQARGDGFFFMGDFEKAAEFYRKSLYLCPVSADCVQKYGLALAYSQFHEKGEVFLKQGVSLNPHDISVYKRLAAYYFDGKEKSKGISVVKKALQMCGEKTSDMLDFMWIADLSFTDMEHALPNTSLVWAKYYSFVLSRGVKNKDYHERILQKGYDYSFNEDVPYVKTYINFVRFYLKEKQYENAFDIALEGLKKYPEDKYLLYYSGVICENLSLITKALEYYKQAVTIDPDFKPALRKINRIS